MEINDMDKITENLWLGNYAAASSMTNLKKEGIKKVLCVMDFPTITYNEEDNINQKVISIVDVPSENIIKYFGESIKFIDGEDKVLVHSMAGASSSATIVIAYIMWKEKKPMDDAIKFVQSKRNAVYPNYGFTKQLRMFENLLKENEYDLNKINFKDINWKFIW